VHITEQNRIGERGKMGRFAPKNTNGIAVKFPAEFMPSVVSLLSKMCKENWKTDRRLFQRLRTVINNNNTRDGSERKMKQFLE
jgi:nuclear transport factor 2 (NTF2) superfamily protein